eukprot:TRINITY_DN15295_c0_g1_i1.p1 TRINITY_DN15295_c0_g1~~TRINITY_DN15295_c0_g1_i1.p1  ORF type:complete len:478 (+),score=98.41 TRINITY_DN15295_c0_g1_i1:81-1436(+)
MPPPLTPLRSPPTSPVHRPTSPVHRGTSHKRSSSGNRRRSSSNRRASAPSQKRTASTGTHARPLRGATKGAMPKSPKSPIVSVSRSPAATAARSPAAYGKSAPPNGSRYRSASSVPTGAAPRGPPGVKAPPAVRPGAAHMRSFSHGAFRTPPPTASTYLPPQRVLSKGAPAGPRPPGASTLRPSAAAAAAAPAANAVTPTLSGVPSAASLVIPDLPPPQVHAPGGFPGAKSPAPRPLGSPATKQPVSPVTPTPAVPSRGMASEQTPYYGYGLRQSTPRRVGLRSDVVEAADEKSDDSAQPFSRRDIVVRGSFVMEGCNYTKYDVGPLREADRRAFTSAVRDDLVACIGQGVRRHDIMIRAAPGPMRNVTLEYPDDVGIPAIVDADWGIEFEYAIRMRSDIAAQTATSTLYSTFNQDGLDLQESRHAWLKFMDAAADPHKIFTLSSQDARRM